MKRIKVVTVIMTIMLAVSGCGKGDSNKDKNEKQNVSENNNLEYIHLSMVNPETINPINNNNQSVGYILDLVYDSLFTIDSNYNAVPQLVDEYSMASDGRSINIKLKDVNWHNGKPVTSDDVEFTIDSIKRSENSSYKPLVENISSVTSTDNKNLTIHFTQPYAFSIDNLIFPIVSKSELSGLNAAESKDYKNNMVGSGAYKISKFNKKSNMVLTLNEDYYDKEKIKDAKKEINVMIVPDEAAQVSMTLALSSDITKVGISDLSEFQEDEFKITNYEGRGYEYMIFNYSNPIMNDINFRKAISYGIDKKKILSEAYLGNVSDVNFPLHSKSKYYDSSVKPIGYNVEKAKESLGKIDIDKVNSNATGKDDASKKEENSKKEETNKKEETDKKENEANKESKEAKKAREEKEKSEKLKEAIKNLNLKIVVNKENSERVKAAHLIRENLNEIGIKSTVEELEGDALAQALDKKEYDLALVGWELSSVPDATDIINYSGYTNEKLTNYLNSLKSSKSVDDTKGIYKSIQKYVNDNVAFVSLGITDDYLVTNKRITGNLKPNDFDIYEGIYNLGFKE
ncbi:ABC transporter substrate-binding protein [Paraclostridium bifermentans]|uniref:ABC transporter substrate-binding protein n=1 Tax=Paraclostridium bifermentans TaxID=1490 RepID=UPI0004687576|nr:ABC transporter substrate-binding protein [Paraclostridium bifermentans]